MLFWGKTGLVFCDLKILFGHPDPLVGDLTGNRESILRLHDEARAMGASLLVMPEMAITGYAPEICCCVMVLWRPPKHHWPNWPP